MQERVGLFKEKKIETKKGKREEQKRETRKIRKGEKMGKELIRICWWRPYRGKTREVLVNGMEQQPLNKGNFQNQHFKKYNF